jgi:hypothetical protein
MPTVAKEVKGRLGTLNQEFATTGRITSPTPPQSANTPQSAAVVGEALKDPRFGYVDNAGFFK